MEKLLGYAFLRQGQKTCDGDMGPIFSVPNIFDTGSKSFSGTKFFPYRFREFFLIPVLRLFPVPIFSDTGSDTAKKMLNEHLQC